jgi:Lar family restriction alleviation protein
MNLCTFTTGKEKPMSELKKCPFCGYEAVLETMTVRKGWEADAHCNGCLASFHTITYDTEEEAIAAAMAGWNQRVGGWIPVSERLPEHDSCVLTYSPRYGMDVDYYNSKLYQPIWIDITHWMPLPQLPKE